jgi:RHH-type rel operon transcriptional repressor/antitoxin RelB
MHTLSFQIDESLNKRLEVFSQEHDRSKAYILRKAVESFLDDQNDLETGRAALDEFYGKGLKTFSLDQIKKENGL